MFSLQWIFFCGINVIVLCMQQADLCIRRWIMFFFLNEMEELPIEAAQLL